jgi:hypothetical protein
MLSPNTNSTAVAPSRGHSGDLRIKNTGLKSAVLALLLVGLASWAGDSQQQSAGTNEDVAAEQFALQQHQTLEDQWGVEIQAVRLTAADYMLDFRYRVLDADKAAPILDRHIKPHVIVERTGHKLQVPISSKLGPLRQTQTHPQAARNYYTFFANPSRHVKRGDLITVVVGDFTAEHLIVE